MTLDEHVCTPNATPPKRPVFVCKNPHCFFYCTDNSLFWDDYGSFYGYKKGLPIYNAAIFSPAKKIETEIYKKDENKRFSWRGFTLFLKYNYEANEAGKILKRKRSWELAINNYIKGRSDWLFLLPFKVLYSSIYRFGRVWDKTEEDRKIRIQENKWKLVDNFLKALKKTN